MRRFAVVLAMVAFVATGCIRSDLNIQVNDDGSGTYTLLFAVNPKALSGLSGLGALGGGSGSGGTVPNAADLCKELQSAESVGGGSGDPLPKGAKVENYNDGDFCGVRITVPFAAGDDVGRSIQEATGGLESSVGSATSFDSFTLKRSGDGWIFEAVQSDAGLGTGTESLGALGDNMTKQLLKDFSVVVRVKLPGRQVLSASNPDKIDGSGTMIWNVDPTAPKTLTARTEKGSPITDKVLTDAGKSLGAAPGSSSSSGGGSGAAVAVLVVLVLLAGAAAFFLLRRRNATPAMAGGPGPAVAGGPGPAVPPYSPYSPAMPTQPPTDQTAPLASPAAPAPEGPVWDAARGAYVHRDPATGRMLVYDQAAAAWKPLE